MTKKEIVQQIASELQLDQTLTRKIAQRFLDTMLEAVFKEGRLELRNFGVFEIKTRSPRKARNPRTNEEVYVPARRVLTFQAGKNVTKRLAKSPPSQ